MVAKSVRHYHILHQLGGGGIACEFEPSLRQDFRAWVVLSEMRHFRGKMDILSTRRPCLSMLLVEGYARLGKSTNEAPRS